MYVFYEIHAGVTWALRRSARSFITQAHGSRGYCDQLELKPIILSLVGGSSGSSTVWYPSTDRLLAYCLLSPSNHRHNSSLNGH